MKYLNFHKLRRKDIMVFKIKDEIYFKFNIVNYELETRKSGERF